MRELTKDEEYLVYSLVDLKMNPGDLVHELGMTFVQACLNDDFIKKEMALRKRAKAEALLHKKQIDIDTILELRPKALDAIMGVLNDKTHPDRTRVALKILGGEFGLIEEWGKKLAEKKASESEGHRGIKIVYDREKDKPS
jgi:hypothetical protein